MKKNKKIFRALTFAFAASIALGQATHLNALKSESTVKTVSKKKQKVFNAYTSENAKEWAIIQAKSLALGLSEGLVKSILALSIGKALGNYLGIEKTISRVFVALCLEWPFKKSRNFMYHIKLLRCYPEGKRVLKTTSRFSSLLLTIGLPIAKNKIVSAILTACGYIACAAKKTKKSIVEPLAKFGKYIFDFECIKKTVTQ